MTPLEQYPGVRRIVYGVLWAAGLVLVAAEGWCLTTGTAQPTWLIGSLGVYPLVGAYVGYQAQANTPAPAPPVTPDRLRATDPRGGA